ncbi:hypothetical protein [Neisseria sp. Ec49-e6-T10]|uniref:hypothetical protein n=1 Tax=Neisseria sp. Ec49-e6-T10 TaxID=3140744 RepID=UPI003EBE4386
MYIVIIAYLYVAMMICLVQDSLARGLIYFVCLVCVPLTITIWILGKKRRNRINKRLQKDQSLNDIE